VKSIIKWNIFYESSIGISLIIPLKPLSIKDYFITSVAQNETSHVSGRTNELDEFGGGRHEKRYPE
jgi:hypothetical protein